MIKVYNVSGDGKLATKSTNERAQQIRDFILDRVETSPERITKLVADEFGISRQASHRYLQRLVNEGLLKSIGRTRDRTYILKPISNAKFSLKIDSKLREDTVWRERMLPRFDDIPPNVTRICEYGFTEMLNNAIDHSKGRHATIGLTMTKKMINMQVVDDGIGIFTKIQKDLNLEHPRVAILELAKGKLTTDPKHHTGEGVFFTSRAFDNFGILSGVLFFSHKEPGDDWLLEDERPTPGTIVKMGISTASERILKQVFDKYSTDEFSFSRTHIPVNLARIGKENLISRSQAKRLLSRFERFAEIILDFKGVEIIGQAFADEVFRIFANEHPNIRIIWVNANTEVEKMILRARGGT